MNETRIMTQYGLSVRPGRACSRKTGSLNVAEGQLSREAAPAICLFGCTESSMAFYRQFFSSDYRRSGSVSRTALDAISFRGVSFG